MRSASHLARTHSYVVQAVLRQGGFYSLHSSAVLITFSSLLLRRSAPARLNKTTALRARYVHTAQAVLHPRGLVVGGSRRGNKKKSFLRLDYQSETNHNLRRKQRRESTKESPSHNSPSENTITIVPRLTILLMRRSHEPPH